MSVQFSKVLSSGQRVKIDDVTVTVDASRYPTRNLSAVHVSRANKPNFFIILLSVAAGVFAVLLSVVGVMEELNRSSRDGGAPFFFFAVLVALVAGFLFSKIKTPYHPLFFCASGRPLAHCS